MSRTATVSKFFGDRDHDFRIGIGEAEELDEGLGYGLMALLERAPAVHVRELREILRVGLVGGGMRKDLAAVHVNRHFQPGYFNEAAGLVIAILTAALRGAPDDPPGEPDGEGKPMPTPSPTAGSATVDSTSSPAPEA